MWLNQHPETGDLIAQLAIERAQKRIKSAKKVVRKKDALKFKKDEIAVMKRIKKAIDPKNLINPGKIFD